jgi:hypothetical protein
LAWDLLQRAREIDANDFNLARTTADIAPLVAEYARLQGQGTRYEKEGNDAAALTAWMAALDLNPVSEICNAAVKRLAGKVAGAMAPVAPPSNDPGTLEIPEVPTR